MFRGPRRMPGADRWQPLAGGFGTAEDAELMTLVEPAEPGNVVADGHHPERRKQVRERGLLGAVRAASHARVEFGDADELHQDSLRARGNEGDRPGLPSQEIDQHVGVEEDRFGTAQSPSRPRPNASRSGRSVRSRQIAAASRGIASRGPRLFMLDEAVDHLTNDGALPLAALAGDRGDGGALVLGQIDLRAHRSHHVGCPWCIRQYYIHHSTARRLVARYDG